MKKTIEFIEQNTNIYEKKNKKNITPDALISEKELKQIKEEPIQRQERKFVDKPRPKTYPGKHCTFCGSPNWNPIHKCPAKEANCRNCEKRGHFANVCRIPKGNKKKMNSTKNSPTPNKNQKTPTKIYTTLNR